MANIIQALWARFFFNQRKLQAEQKYSLSKRSINEPTAVEKLFCVPFGRLPCHLTGEIRSCREIARDNEVVHLEAEQSRFIGIMGRRVRNYRFIPYDFRALLYVAMVSSNVASCVMYLTYIQYRAHLGGLQKITLPLLTDVIFPDGHPDKDNLNAAWYDQKVDMPDVGLVNLLDYPPALRTIR